MIVSGTCAVLIGFMPGLPWPVGLIWGFWVVADSAKFSTVIIELGDQTYVGAALTLQLAIGYVLTVPTLWLIPIVRDAFGWGFAFGLLAEEPVVGTIAMRRLDRIESDRGLGRVESLVPLDINILTYIDLPTTF